jgi:putative nucleotidyltransferase with HDIG domain
MERLAFGCKRIEIMIKEIEKIVETACKQETNYFGYGIWAHHILPVVKYAKLMAKRLGANEEIVEIAALLHDYASVKDYKLYEDHHLHGAELAEQILNQFNYPQDKIEQVKHCILCHRGSKVAEKLTKEALCIADADSMAHFDSISSLFYLAFFSHKMGIDEANNWLMQKLERSWNKLSPQAKEIIKDKYEASKLLLGSQN